MLKNDLYQQKGCGVTFKRVSESGFAKKEIDKLDLQYVKKKLSNLPDYKKQKWDDFIYFLKKQGSVKDADLQDLVFTIKNNHSQSAPSSSAGVAAEPQQIAVGSSSGTRGVGYPSSAPQPIVTEAGARVVEAGTHRCVIA